MKEQGGIAWGPGRSPSLGETLLPSSDAGASETLSPETMANCHLPITLEFTSGFWALHVFVCMRTHMIYVYGLARVLRSEDNPCCCSSKAIHLVLETGPLLGQELTK